MGFINKVLFLNQKKFEVEIPPVDPEIPPVDPEIPPIEEVNIFTNNFNPYSSSGNLNGISYSSSAVGDIVNKTITHTLDGFSSTTAFIFEGFEVGKTYIYSFEVEGSLKDTFIQFECLTQSNVELKNVSLTGATSIEMQVVENTYKLRIRLGTAGTHIGSSTFSNIKVVEKIS